MMKKFAMPWLMGWLLLAHWTGVQAQQAHPLSPRNASYTMNVRLDTERHLVHGREILTWRNITEHATGELRFHLYYNAWRNDKSSFLNSVRWQGRNLNEYRNNDWAYCDVQSIALLGDGDVATDLRSSMEFIQPDDSNPYDRTVLRVKLPRAVQPGETVRLDIGWELKVPRTFARTGVRGDYYFIAQWFPKIGVLEADGTWNCHQFIQTEFYADFGVYDVRLTVPSGWIIGATGREIETRENDDGTTTHRFYQEDVHDFAWTTCPYFRVHTKRFSEPGLPEVEMRLLLMPDHADKKDRYFEAASASLKYYGTWWGPYPYDHITIVEPAYGSGSGGMEYPTLFSGGTHWLSPRAALSPEGVTVHEAGHQFWYGIIADNEFEYAWLDEGFNTYSTTRTMEQAFPNPVLVRRYFEGFIPVAYPSVQLAQRTAGADLYDGFRSRFKLDRMSRLSWQLGPGAYRDNSYSKPGMMLRTLENTLGWDTFQKIMSTYFERWKFHHPRPEDFFAVVNEVSGQDLGIFFAQTYGSSNVFDYAVGRVKSTLIRTPRGYVEQGDSLAFQETGKPAADSGADKQYQSTVYVRRWGEAISPVDIKITFANGDSALETWDGVERWARFDYRQRAKVSRVEVDPQHKLVLDVNYSNNSWTSKPRAKAAAIKWASKWMIWLQQVMEFFAFFS